MGTKAVRLTQKQIEHAKPKEKNYVLSDGDGLQLRVRTNGSRLWNFQHSGVLFCIYNIVKLS
jgi:Arm domain-containing DNA-binding protein